MKKIINLILLGIICLSTNVYASCLDNDECFDGHPLIYSIIDASDPRAKWNGIYLNDDNDLIAYNGGYFRVENGVLYLDNSHVKIEISQGAVNHDINKIIISTSGNSVIHELTNVVQSAFVPLGTSSYVNSLYTYYMNFEVIGDGSLEIERISELKKDDHDQQYYKCWKYTPSYSIAISEDKNCWGLLYRLDSGWQLTIPEDGFTYNDIKSISYAYGLTFLEGQVCKICPASHLFYGRQNEIINIYTLPDVDFSPYYISDIPGLLEEHNIFIDFDMQEYNTSIEYGMNFFEQLVSAKYVKPTEPTTELVQPTRNWGEEAIQTNMTRSFTETGSYLIGNKVEGNLDEITTTQAGSITFTSSEAFDSNYHLGVSDITEELSEEDASRIEAKTDKTLIKLYDINMLDKDNKVVDMGNGTYTIKVALSDLLKKYNEYQIVYIGESSVELIPARIEDEYIVFNTTHLSKYGIVGLEKTTKRIIDTSNTEVKNPKTADNMIYYGIVFATLVVASIFTIVRIKTIEASD